MKFIAVLAAAAGVSASYGAAPGNVTVVTEVVQSYTTYCPGPTEITHGGTTYTVTEATTLTITDCPCTITKPVITSTAVACSTCAPYNSSIPAIPPPATGGVTPTSGPAPIATAGAGKAAVLSGAGLAGIVGLAAFVL